MLQRGQGCWASLHNELLQDSYLTRNVSHLSGIITLGNLKLNIDWHSATICISLVLNNFIKNRLIEKSSDLRLVLLKGETSRSHSKIGRHLLLINSRITSSDTILPILSKSPFSRIARSNASSKASARQVAKRTRCIGDKNNAFSVILGTFWRKPCNVFPQLFICNIPL